VSSHELELTVEEIGGRGDGIAHHEGARVFIPFTVPGDRVLAAPTGRRGGGAGATLVSVLAPGPDRTEPVCPHFGDCGGCALQHLAAHAYRDWKVERVRVALSRRGFADPPLAPLRATPAGARRRASLVAIRAGGRTRLGFHARASHRVVDIAVCPVMEPDLVAVLEPLRAALDGILDTERLGIVVTRTETGIDLVVESSRAPDLAAREKLAAFAEAADLARASWRAGGETEPIAWRRAAVVRFADVSVTPPPGAFLQASAAGEAAIRDAVLEGIGDARHVADLYAGCGTLTFPMLRAAAARLHAVDGAAASVAAMEQAARGAGLTDRLSTETRDLARRPLVGAELDAFDAVVFDPPRAGARRQAEALARSSVPRVIAVSCDPASFARDARALVDGGYRLETVVPIDQFLWSAQVELVAVFSRVRS
jgi:23S rRNA (uracil1939-C5)-methyltransferase